MLLQLNIQNFAIVRSLELDWRNGMTTITGETGAGKSIAIDALGLCLGDRAVTNVVRPNCKKAELSATFNIETNTHAKAWLEKHDLIQEDECILRRVISAEGRSRAYINGSQVPLTQLKEIGAFLINIHGQHDHQLIVKASEQRKMLDEYAGHHALMDDVKYYFQQWKTLTKELSLLEQNKQQREAQKQLLQYQVKELDEFSIQEDEFGQLEQDYNKLSHAQDLMHESLNALQQISENEQYNAIDVVRSSVENLSSLAEIDSNLAPINQMLNDALIQLEEASNDLRTYHDKLDIDPEQFSVIEERYSTAISLAKKHQISPNALVDFHRELSKQLAAISSDDSRLEQINSEIENCLEQYHHAAELLSESREKFAEQLSQQITESMHELNMPHGQFKIAISPQTVDAPSLHGIDDTAFLVSLNPGQQLEAMSKVASGGELSRISLAMQVILADKVTSPTMIFDEVDVGISGPTAAMVGNKLQQLGEKAQVICVTHLPQVASKGHQQMFVAKLTDGEHTETTVTELSAQGRVKEIARLLAGDKITDHSLANAEELLAS